MKIITKNVYINFKYAEEYDINNNIKTYSIGASNIWTNGSHISFEVNEGDEIRIKPSVYQHTDKLHHIYYAFITNDIDVKLNDNVNYATSKKRVEVYFSSSERDKYYKIIAPTNCIFYCTCVAPDGNNYTPQSIRK